MKLEIYRLFLLYKEPQFQYGILYIEAINMDDASRQARNITTGVSPLTNIVTWFLEKYIKE